MYAVMKRKFNFRQFAGTVNWAERRYRGVVVRLQNARSSTGKGGQTPIESNFWSPPRRISLRWNAISSIPSWDTQIFVFHYKCRKRRNIIRFERVLKRNVDRGENYINYIFPNRRFNEGVFKLPDEVTQWNNNRIVEILRGINRDIHWSRRIVHYFQTYTCEADNWQSCNKS